MGEEKQINEKNVVVYNDVPFYKRWTVLFVEVSVITKIREYAMQNRVSTSRALKELIERNENSDESKTS